MADYIGNYVEEFGKTRQSILFSVFLVSSTQGKILTSLETDSLYLPAIFVSNTQPYSNQGICKLIVKPRRAKLWINNDSYLSVPIPFRASSTNYNQFFIDASFNLNISTIGYQGESVKSDWVEFYASSS